MYKKINLIYKIFIQFLYYVYFIIFKINISQSLKYQSMISIMEIYKLKKLDLIEECDYEGGDTVFITYEDWKFICNFIKKRITKNYSLLLKDYTLDEIYNYFFEMLELNGESEYYNLVLSSNSIYFLEFTMKNKGHSYQYNGYKKSDVKLQQTANMVASIALPYTAITWLHENNFIDLKKCYPSILIISIGVLVFYLLRYKTWNIKIFIIFITVIIFIA